MANNSNQQSAISSQPQPEAPWKIERGWVGAEQRDFLTHDGRDGVQLDVEAAAYIRGLMDSDEEIRQKTIAACVGEFDRMLQERILIVLASARHEDEANPSPPVNEEDTELAHAESHCFHFEELRRILKGQPVFHKQHFMIAARPASVPSCAAAGAEASLLGENHPSGGERSDSNQ